MTLNETYEDSSNRVDSAEQSLPGIVAVFSPAFLTRLDPVSKELEAVLELGGSEVALQVELDEFEISTEEFKLLDNGAVVVLPKSYQPNWQINAKSVTKDIELDIAGKLTCSDDRSDVLLATKESAKQSVEPKEAVLSDDPVETAPNTILVINIESGTTNPSKIL